MLSKQNKDRFWATVSECLVAFHGFPKADARKKCRELRRALAASFCTAFVCDG